MGTKYIHNNSIGYVKFFTQKHHWCSQTQILNKTLASQLCINRKNSKNNSQLGKMEEHHLLNKDAKPKC